MNAKSGWRDVGFHPQIYYREQESHPLKNKYFMKKFPPMGFMKAYIFLKKEIEV